MHATTRMNLENMVLSEMNQVKRTRDSISTMCLKEPNSQKCKVELLVAEGDEEGAKSSRFMGTGFLFGRVKACWRRTVGVAAQQRGRT